MTVKTFSVGVLGANCHVVINGDKAVIIDLGGDFEKINDYIQNEGAKPVAVLLTHGHFDHVGGVYDACKALPIYIHESEKEFLNDDSLNLCRDIGGVRTENADNICTFSEGNLQLDGFSVKVIHTPGHTCGSSCFLIDDMLFSGDTLFLGSYGRYDLPTGNFQALTHSIVKLIDGVTDSVAVYPGHGEMTTIKYERENNPLYIYAKNQL